MFRLALLLVLLSAACGEPSATEADAGDAEDAAPACLTSSEVGASIPLRIGSTEGGEFVDLAEGQEVELVWGYQGYLMIIFGMAAEADLDGADEVCFHCEVSLSSSTGAFADSSLDSMFHFLPNQPDLYSSQVLLVLVDDPALYDGATAQLTASCDQTQRSTAIERTLGLSVPPR